MKNSDFPQDSQRIVFRMATTTDRGAQANAQLSIAPTRSLQVMRDASELYSRVFGYASRELSLNPKLLLAIAANGGTTIAATTPDRELVGFAYGFAGFDGSRVYHYSQAAFVAPGMQGAGIGRLLKQAQADEARALGMTTMRWAFDPLLANNAHFNFTVLGARGLWFAPRLYDDDLSARLIVEWQLDEPRPGLLPPTGASVNGAATVPITPRQWATAVEDGDSVVVPIPAPATLRTLAPAEVTALRFTLSSTIAGLLERGLAATACSIVDDLSAAYRFTRTAAA